MSRSSKKMPYVEEKLFTRVEAMNAKGEKKVLKTWSRSSTIFPEFVGHTIAVHDGRKHVLTSWSCWLADDNISYLILDGLKAMLLSPVIHILHCKFFML